MSQVTEVVFLPLEEGQHPEDPSSSLKPQFDKMLQTIVSQPGAQRLYWGRQIEHPTIATMFIDWDSLADHQKFIESDMYKPFMEEVLSLTAGAPSLYHVHFKTHPPADAFTLGAVTEVLQMYFPASYSDEDVKAFEARYEEFATITSAATPDVKAVFPGWSVEEVTIPGSEEKGKAFVLVIAWTTLQHHMDYRNSQSFTDSIPLLRGAKDVKGAAVFHVAAQEFVKQ